MVFSFFRFEENNSIEWILLFILSFTSGYLVYLYYTFHPYYNTTVQKFYIFLSLNLFYSNLVLLVSKILQFSKFNGGLILFLTGSLIFAVILVFQEKEVIPFLISGDLKPAKAIRKIYNFLDLVDNREASRNSKTLLYGYIQTFEDKCTLQNCALKKYLKHFNENGVDSLIFLLQHCESLYQTAISKFPSCVRLKISYAFFLLERMKKKKQARQELINAQKQSTSFEMQFIIYRFQKFLEEQTFDLSDNEDNLDIVTNIEYKNYFSHFKNAIVKASSLYLDFWSLLLNPNQDSQEDLSKLNDYGTKINILVEEIESYFQKIQKVKNNDSDTLRYYSDFYRDILNDKEKAKKLKNIREESNKINQIQDEEENILNLDLHSLPSNNQFQYIVVSGQTKSIGIISNVSLGACLIFGYTKDELVGKSIDIIIPEVYQKIHHELLNEKVTEFRKTVFSGIDQNGFRPRLKEFFGFARNKSRYLIPILFKVGIVPAENNDLAFVAKIYPQFNSLTAQSNLCYIITDTHLMIQNFTPNAKTLLGMSSTAMNNKVEITEYIKQFYEDFLRYAVENEDKTQDQKLQIKKNIINKKFKSPTLVNWKKYNQISKRTYTIEKGDFRSDYRSEYDAAAGRNNGKDGHYSFYEGESFQGPHDTFLDSKVNYINVDDNCFILTVTDATIKEHHVGYIFKFEKRVKDSTPLGSSYIGHKNFSSDKIMQTKKKFNERCGSLKTVEKPVTPIDKSFIPDSDMNFHLDAKAFSYKINSKPPQKEELKEFLKKTALEKLHLVTNQVSKSKSEESEKSSDISSDEYKSESYTSSQKSEEYSSDLEEKEQSSFKTNSISKSNISPSQNKSFDENTNNYYHVNISIVKLSVYDYKKNIFQEMKNSAFNRYTQVEMRTTVNIKEIEDDLITGDEASTFGDEMNKKIESSDKGIGNPNLTEEKHKALINQIEYSLGKEESQPTITRMKIASVFVFLFILLSGFFLLYIVITSFNEIEESAKLIIFASKVAILHSKGTLYIMELVLLNNEFYNGPIENKPEYIRQIFNKSLSSYNSSQSLLNYILTTSSSLSEENEERLSNSTINIYMINENNEKVIFKLPLTWGFIELNSAWYQICHTNINIMTFSNKDVYYFLTNGLNEAGFGISRQNTVYMNQLKVNITTKKRIFGFIIIALVIELVCIFLLMSFVFREVSKRKESYLEVFFEIGSSVIRSSLEKCESFTKKLQVEAMNDEITINDNESTESENLYSNHPVIKESNVQREKKKTSKESRQFNIRISFCLIIIGIFSIVIFLFFIYYFNNYTLYCEFFKTLVELENEYLRIFNALRMFMFEPNFNVNMTSSEEAIEESLANAYNFRSIKQTYISKYFSKIPGDFQTKYTAFFSENSCNQQNGYFSSVEECDNFLSNSGKFGIGIVLNYFVEGMRKLKNISIKNQLDRNSSNFTYNLTIGETKDNRTEDMEKYLKYHPIQNFIVNEHLSSLVTLTNIILPLLDQLCDILYECIRNDFKKVKVVFIIIISIFYGLVTIFYFLFYLPFELKLNQTIYKTKNMLSIIPKEVLANLGNIQKVLDIGITNKS